MSRLSSLLLAAAMAVTPLALGASAASAQSNRSGEHYSGRGWDDDGWRWGHRRHHNRGYWNSGPGFSFSFGVPFANTYSYYRPYQRDCYRGWDGALYCRAY